MDKPKIMVVEDEFIIASEIQKALEKNGYDVVAVESSGEAAIKNVAKVKPELILMDIMLNSEMDGIKTAMHIHSKSNIPIVYLSSYSNKEILEDAKLTEPYGYLVKPFNENELRTTIEMSLYKSKMEKERQKHQDKIKILQGFLTICAYCKKIRDDKGYWKNVAEYIRDHSEAEFSHGICPDCMKKNYPDFQEEY